MEINFLFVVIDGLEPWNIGPCINYMEKNGFNYIQSVQGVRLVKQEGVILPGKNNRPHMAPAFYLFASCESDLFESFFGFPYSDEIISKIPNIVFEKQVTGVHAGDQQITGGLENG